MYLNHDIQAHVGTSLKRSCFVTKFVFSVAITSFPVRVWNREERSIKQLKKSTYDFSMG